MTDRSRRARSQILHAHGQLRCEPVRSTKLLKFALQLVLLASEARYVGHLAHPTTHKKRRSKHGRRGERSEAEGALLKTDHERGREDADQLHRGGMRNLAVNEERAQDTERYVLEKTHQDCHVRLG